MPRKQSPTSVAIPSNSEEEENKYQKKRRRARRRINDGTPRLSWPTFGMLYCIGTFFLVWKMASESSSYRSKMLNVEKFKRAMKLQRQRNNDHGGNSNNLKGTSLKEKQVPSSQLQEEFQNLEHVIVDNVAGGPLFIRPHLLPPLPGQPEKKTVGKAHVSTHSSQVHDGVDPFRAHRKGTKMAWVQEYESNDSPPRVDYTKHDYTYPKVLDTPPGGYPQLKTLGDMLTQWPQNEMDHPPSPFIEHLLHFNYSDPKERAAALNFRQAELPFKLYDVPEVTEAGIKWTDAYVSQQFDSAHPFWGGGPPRSKGTCQESPNHFFAFFTPPLWKVSTMGVPPTRTNDWSFQMWARHARYADAVGLTEDRPHFYWQAGVPKEERLANENQWTFVSKDLPSFSSPTDTFFVFDVKQQKGIQCRFGERGVTAATHYDSGRNMIAMVTGAKRYILSPPKECSKLGIVTERENAIFRHSLLNFGNLQYLDDVEQGKSMSADERAWLERAKNSMAVDTVLKAGEVLYIPSHWFHYITSLQKSAQCNVRSGVEKEGTDEFGGARDVRECSD